MISLVYNADDAPLKLKTIRKKFKNVCNDTLMQKTQVISRNSLCIKSYNIL